MIRFITFDAAALFRGIPFRGIPISLLLVLAGCVEIPRTDEDVVLLTSNYPIVEVNSSKTAPQYSVQLPEGNNDVVIVYTTYMYDYHCRFILEADAANRYEVTDYGHRYPLTLFTWEYVNSMWARRSLPTDPASCDALPPGTVESSSEGM